MGKINVNLMKGIEQQEDAIDKSKMNDVSQNAEKPVREAKKKQAAKSTFKNELFENGAYTRPQRQAFSFRADKQKIEHWKLYAEAVGTNDIGELWTAAIEEYIQNHELTADQKIVYNLKWQALEAQKKLKS